MLQNWPKLSYGTPGFIWFYLWQSGVAVALAAGLAEAQTLSVSGKALAQLAALR